MDEPKLNFALPSARERRDWVRANGRRDWAVRLSARVILSGEWEGKTD